MKRIRIPMAVAVVALVAGLALMPGRAMAAQPVITTYSYSFSYDPGICGYPMTWTIQGTGRVLEFSSDKQIGITQGTSTESLTSAYGSLTTHDAGTATFYNDGGTWYLVQTGRTSTFTVPGYGLAEVFIEGRMVFQGVEVVPGFILFYEVSWSGPTKISTNWAAVCTYLGPPGYVYPG